jgi:hypothetical protein
MARRGPLQTRLCGGCGRDVVTSIKPPTLALCECCGGKKRKRARGAKRDRGRS